MFMLGVRVFALYAFVPPPVCRRPVSDAAHGWRQFYADEQRDDTPACHKRETGVRWLTAMFLRIN